MEKEELDRRFTECYRAHLRDVYSYSYYRVGNHHDAEDLTEQTFLQAYRHFERALEESNGRPLRPWLIRIAHNLAANLYRDRARKPQANLDAIAEPGALHTTEDLVEEREELRHVLDSVQKLPDDRREALIMRFALGMDNREIARAMGKSDGATKVLIHRAIKQLETIVAEQGGREVSSQQPDIESLLRMALKPVEPPDSLSEKLEEDLQRIVDISTDEIDSWQADALHDPRTWVKPAAAVAVGTVAAGAVAVLGVTSRRRRSQPKGADPVKFLGEAATTISREIQRRTRG